MTELVLKKDQLYSSFEISKELNMTNDKFYLMVTKIWIIMKDSFNYRSKDLPKWIPANSKELPTPLDTYIGLPEVWEKVFRELNEMQLYDSAGVKIKIY